MFLNRDNKSRQNMKKRPTPRSLGFVGLLLVLSMVSHAWGLTRIRDIARPLGERTNALTGYGLVVGLKGTGDNGDALIMTRPFSAMLQAMGNPISLDDLGDGKNTAYVWLTAEVGRNGARWGDQIDVQVMSVYNCKSLEGGRLIGGSLQGGSKVDNQVYAMPQGLIILPDETLPTSGVVKKGATMERDVIYDYWNEDPRTGEASFTLVLDDQHANFQIAKRIGMDINEEFSNPDELLSRGSVQTTAMVLGPKNIHITIPASQARNAPLFIARVLNLAIELPDPQAMVVIDEQTQTIVITGDVDISPVAVHVNGMMIRIADMQGAPVTNSETQWAQLDTSGQDNVKLDELIKALDRLNVDFEGKMNAIFEINKAQSLRAKLITR
jgi:flagellar P-ring protein precursor FlgI